MKDKESAGDSCSSAAVEWQPPQKANGSPVLSYRVQMRSSKGKMATPWEQVWAGESLHCKVLGQLILDITPHKYLAYRSVKAGVLWQSGPAYILPGQQNTQHSQAKAASLSMRRGRAPALSGSWTCANRLQGSKVGSTTLSQSPLRMRRAGALTVQLQQP